MSHQSSIIVHQFAINLNQLLLLIMALHCRAVAHCHMTLCLYVCSSIVTVYVVNPFKEQLYIAIIIEANDTIL